MIGGHRLHEILPEQVTLTHRCSVLHKALEAFPSGIVIVFPLDLEFNFVLILCPGNSVANDVLDSEPAALFRLLFLFLGLACVFSIEEVFTELGNIVDVSLLAPLGDAELQFGLVDHLRTLVPIIGLTLRFREHSFLAAMALLRFLRIRLSC